MKNYPIDKDLFYMEGIVNEIVEMTERNAPHPNLPLSFMGAVSFIGNILGARYISENGLSSNMYNAVIARSGTGKESSRATNKLIANELRQGENSVKVEIIENLASYEGVETILNQGRNDLLLQIDEIDNFLTCLTDRRNTVYINMMKNLLTAYTSSVNGIFIRVNKQLTESKYIPVPNISIFGACTPKALYDSLDESLIEKGLISRFLFVPSYERSKFNMPQNIMNFSTIDKIRKICSIPYAKSIKDLNVIKYTDGAKKLLAELNMQIDDFIGKCNDNIDSVLYSRICEKVVKLAMVYAISVNQDNPIIDESMFIKCSKLVMQSVNWMIADIKENMYNSVIEKRCKKLYDSLVKLGDVPYFTKREIYKHFMTNKQELQTLLDNLIDMGKIEKVASASGEYYKVSQ